MSSTIICNIVRLLIFLLLVNIVLGLSVPSDDNRRIYQSLKQRSAENDNEYVWFTRNIHDEISNADINQQEQQQRKQQDLFRFKVFNNVRNRKYPSVKSSMYEAK